MAPLNRLRLSLVLALFVGAMLGAGVAALFERDDQRRSRTAEQERAALEALDRLQALGQRDVLAARLALHQPAAAPTAADARHARHYAAALESVRERATSQMEPMLHRLRRSREQLDRIAGDVPAADAAGQGAARIDGIAADQDEAVARLRNALPRASGGGSPRAPIPPFVSALSIGSLALLLALAAIAVNGGARRVLGAASRAGIARREPGLVDVGTPRGTDAHDACSLAAAGLREALHHLADWILLCDADGRVEQVLAGNGDRLGLGGRSLRGRSLWHLTADMHPDMLRALAPADGSVGVTLTSLGLPPHEVPVRLVLARLAEHDGSRLLAIARDRSDEIEIERSVSERTTQLLRARADVERLREKVLYVAEEEQERIGQELHDGVGQQLAGIAFLTQALANRMKGQDAKMVADLNWLSDLASRTAESVRGISRQLGASQFEHGNLALLLEQLCEDTASMYDIECRFEAVSVADLDLHRIDANATRHVFRIAQESLTNAIRHGRAGHVAMRVDGRRERVRLAVRDDGVGFDPKRFGGTSRRGLGLHSMRIRASIIGATLHIRTGANGSLVLLNVPAGAIPPP